MEIRPASQADIPFLAEMSLLAAFPPGPLPDGAADLPRVRRWTEGWGRPGDAGVVAWDGGERVGAAWCRFQDEAIVRDDQGVAPAEIAIAVVPSRRSRGVGGDLLVALDRAAVERGHQALCLTVSPMNPAVRLYERAGFETVSRDGSKIAMMARLTLRLHGARRGNLLVGRSRAPAMRPRDGPAARPAHHPDATVSRCA